MGVQAHDVDKVILRYRKELVTGLLCPMLTLGQDGSGSFALAENLKDLTQTVINARLKELRDQLNHDLIPQLFMLNGWDVSVLPYFDFIKTDENSLDEILGSLFNVLRQQVCSRMMLLQLIGLQSKLVCLFLSMIPIHLLRT